MRHNIQGSRTITRRAKDGDKGNDGSQGAFSIQKDWIIGDTHHNTSEVVDFIYVRGDSGATSYWYKKATLGTNVASTPPQGGVTPYTIGGVTYEKVSWLDTLAVKTFIAEGGNLGGLIFKNNKLISQLGTINGQTSSDFNNPNFVPNILIDGNTGYVEFANAKIRGNIQADGGNLGILVVEETGNIAMLDPDTLIPRLVFSKTNLPLIGDLTGGVNSSGGMDVGSGYLSGATGSSVTLSGSTNVTKAGAVVTFSGATISLSGAGTVEPNGIASFIEVGLRLYIDDAPNNYLGGAFIHFTSPVGQQTIESNVVNIPPTKFTLNKAGVVTLKLERVSIPLLNASLTSANVTTSRLDWSHIVQGIKRQQYGLNGMMFFYSNNWFHFTEFGGLVLGGKTDMPGVLAKGRISSSGSRTTANAWGAHNSTGSISKPSGTGSYRVPVNCPNGNYDVNISPRTANRTFYVGTTTATYFDVYFRDQNGNAQDSEFSYTLVGDNY